MNALQTGIILNREHWSQMETDVTSRSSEEACGLVAGINNRSTIVIPVTNILHDPHRFRMDPRQELEAFELAEKNGWEIIAIYHSHPHGIETPSPTDFSELTFPGVVYLIWYQEADVWQCRGYFMLSHGSAEEVPVITSTK